MTTDNAEWGILALGDRSHCIPPGGRAYDKREQIIYLVGGGLLSLAAVAFVIHGGDVRGGAIKISKEAETIGSTLDGAGPPQDSYLLRDGRMIKCN